VDLYDILACPTCKVAVIRQNGTLLCRTCQQSYPIVNNVPVLLPDGRVPATEYQHELQVRTGYDPWIHRVVLQSLPTDSIVLEIGAGNMAFDVPNIIRMDVTLTPYVDVVGDAHALPFLPGTFAFVFSLAVIEHLRQPFVAAAEMYNALRNGGYVYGECNFVFPYHGYPHHYFNMTQQGLEEIFKSFSRLRSGVAPYQMPSFAVYAVVDTFLHFLSSNDDPDIQQCKQHLQQLLTQPLRSCDRQFSEEGALRCAAGVFFFGMKSVLGPQNVIPAIVQSLYQQTPALQQQFPNLFDLGTVRNIMVWAQTQGQQQFSAIADYFAGLIPFHKTVAVNEENQKTLRALPVIEPLFGYIPELRPQRSFWCSGVTYVKQWVSRMKRAV
jgi:uncharacterized protein YbaR (Trm112 family)